MKKFMFTIGSAIFFALTLYLIKSLDINMGQRVAYFLMWLAGASLVSCFVIADWLEVNTYSLYKRWF